MSFNRHRQYTELELQRLFRDGHSLAFRRLIDPHYGPLLHYLRTLTEVDADAEDVCMEVIEEFAGIIQGGTDIRNVKGFLRSLARNRFIDFLRKNSRRVDRLLFEIQEELLPEADATPYDHTLDHRRDVLILQIDRLNEEQRHVIVEVYLYGQKPQDVAAETQWPISKVYNLLNGARRTLARRCRREDQDQHP